MLCSLREVTSSVIYVIIIDNKLARRASLLGLPPRVVHVECHAQLLLRMLESSGAVIGRRRASPQNGSRILAFFLFRLSLALVPVATEFTSAICPVKRPGLENE
jgi:hypothetical protein